MFRFGDPGGRMYTVAGTSGANLQAHWSSVGSSGSWSVVAGQGRITGTCLRYLTNQSGSLVKNLDAQPTLGIAFAYRQSATQSNGMPICGFFEGGNNQFDLRVNGDGSLQATRNGAVVGTVAAAVQIAVWVHIEFKVTFHPTAGVVQLWVNSVQKLNLTNQNTRNTANSWATGVGIGCFGNMTFNVNLDFDDIVIYDAQPLDLNGLADITGPIGDCRLVWLLPTAGGNTTQWVADTGNNFARVNEATPDGDTSYVSTAALNAIDTYTLADLPASAAIVRSIAVCCYAKKTDAGTRSIAGEVRTNGVNYGNAVLASLSTSYQYYFFGWGQNPFTNASWTPAEINALEAGQKVTS